MVLLDALGHAPGAFERSPQQLLASTHTPHRHAGMPFTAILASGDAQAKQRARQALLPLLDAMGHMMLRGGCFHADPHAGQLLLQVPGTQGDQAKRTLCILSHVWLQHCANVTLLT